MRQGIASMKVKRQLRAAAYEPERLDALAEQIVSLLKARRGARARPLVRSA